MVKKHKHKHVMRRPQRKEPETEKEIADRLKELEYARITLGHHGDIRRVIYEDRLTIEIKRLETKLEELKKSTRVL